MFCSLSALFVAPMPLAGLAATRQTRVLDVKNVTCGLCPVTVKKSLGKISGVTRARIDHEKKTASLTFDADRTDTMALIKATTDSRVPSEVHT